MKKTILVILSLVAILTIFRFRHFFTGSSKPEKAIAGSTVKSLKVGYLPVTCHLTCPVTDYATKSSVTSTRFESKRFSDFPTVVSAIQSKQLQATFMVAPLAMKLREDGVPVKICYLGHRDGSELIVAKNNTAKNLHDLKGKKIAIPSLYSNQHFVILKLMEKQGMKADDIRFVQLPPPDMPTALGTGAIDAFFVGEPFCAKAEMEGIGRVLYYARDIWPNFISCVLVVHEDLINEHPETVKDLVRGIAASGAWAETHRAEAASLAATYYRQDPKVLSYVLTSNPRRVSYVNLTPKETELQSIAEMGIKIGLLKKQLPISDLVDSRFIPDSIQPAAITLNQKPLTEN